MKAKQFAVIGELYKLRLINKQLLLDLSHSLTISHSSRVSRFASYFDLIDHMQNNCQLLMLNKIYDSNIHENRFFKDTESSFIIQVLRQVKIVKVSKGEFIYSANMPAKNGTVSSLVYLIMEGKVNCLANRSLCFKSYTKGSYFGDIEMFCKTPRLFSVRAECPTTLALISVLNLEEAFKVYRESHLKIMKKALQKLIKVNIGLQRVTQYDLVVRTDPFWNDDKTKNMLHSMVASWLESFHVKEGSSVLE